jgi:hypothetical protein
VDIFISYASEHLDDARIVREHLKSTGHSVWFDKDSILGGAEWDYAIMKGHEDADLILHLCSDEILKRRGVVNREIKRSLQLYEDEPLRSMLIIPIRLEEMQLPHELTRFQQIDYFRPDWRERLDRAIAERQSQLGSYPNLLPPAEQVTVQPLADERRVEITDSSDSYECRGTYIEYVSNEPYWRMITSDIASRVTLQYLTYRGWFQVLPKDDELMKYSWEMTCEQFFRADEIVSLRLTEYFFSGGAHGNYQISTLNYFGNEPINMERGRGTLGIDQLIHDDDSATAMFEMCRDQIIEFIENAKEDFGFRQDLASLPHWDLLKAFNIGPGGLTFNFSPYDVLPWAYGSSEIMLPWSSVSDHLTDLGLRLMQRVTQAAT